MLCASLDGRGFGGEWIHVYVLLSPFAVHLKLPQHCLSAMLLLSYFSCVRLCVTPWTAAHQAPLSMGLSRQEHWSGLPLPSAWITREVPKIHILDVKISHRQFTDLVGFYSVIHESGDLQPSGEKGALKSCARREVL